MEVLKRKLCEDTHGGFEKQTVRGYPWGFELHDDKQSAHATIRTYDIAQVHNMYTRIYLDTIGLLKARDSDQHLESKLCANVFFFTRTSQH